MAMLREWRAWLEKMIVQPLVPTIPHSASVRRNYSKVSLIVEACWLALETFSTAQALFRPERYIAISFDV
jgi:hypothetical protein